MKSKMAKACDISQAVKKRVWERDNQRCIICGNTQAMPNAHFIPRSKGGLGVEKNIVTLCIKCHRAFDQTTQRPIYYEYIKKYLKSKYDDWCEDDLIFKRYKNGI